MKVLFLGNSNELYGDIPESERRTSRAARALEEAFGEPVETVVRTIWPTEKLPGTIDKWMRESGPDIVYLNVVAFWFNFQSVPLKVERMLGPLGRPVKDAGIKASQVPWLGHTALFHWLREICQRVIGGATFFEPDEVTEVISDCVRTIVRHEQAVSCSRDHAVRRTGTSRRSGERGRRRGGCGALCTGALSKDCMDVGAGAAAV
jgi:hypothetical protein